MVKGPKHLGDYPDRHIDLQSYIEDDFIAFVDKIEAAGWERRWVLAAIIELAENHHLFIEAIEHDEDEIVRTHRSHIERNKRKGR